MLNYNIKGTGLDVTDELRTYVERQLAAAEKFLQGDTTAHVDVELEYQALREGVHYRAEFTVSVAGAVPRASKSPKISSTFSAETFLSAFIFSCSGVVWSDIKALCFLSPQLKKTTNNNNLIVVYTS